jgi:glycine/D-amino acid oxidase-like deaminating enzyme
MTGRLTSGVAAGAVKLLALGGGVAGLATALAMGRAGHEVVLLERDATARPATQLGRDRPPLRRLDAAGRYRPPLRSLTRPGCAWGRQRTDRRKRCSAAGCSPVSNSGASEARRSSTASMRA